MESEKAPKRDTIPVVSSLAVVFGTIANKNITTDFSFNILQYRCLKHTSVM